ncbi:ABC transporter permease subunit [Mesoplasma photuris]|uniref:ABC transporter permease subunit n=1 Tax=Mesoplasma photuris TaxID=217731 RepID=UPI0004E258CF|nr:ABC transporter permease [Mesoplasma photuris]
MRFKQYLWSFKKRTNEFYTSTEYKTKKKFSKASLLAIVCGFIVAGIIIAAQNVNPFSYFGNLVKVAFDPLFINQTLNWFAVYIVAGLGIAIGFKSGVFNIGMAGQMLLATSLSSIVMAGTIKDNPELIPLMVFVTFIICIVSSSLLAGFAGLLKSKFNIHEVVTTIMLNWIVWYVFKFFFNTFTEFGGVNQGTSFSMPNDVFSIGGSSILIPLLIAFGCLLLIGILFAKTTFGFKLKAVGSSQTASKYAGINVKSKIIQAMMLSGAFAGIAAFISMYTVSPNTSFDIDVLPALGYDAIAVSLVAFNNPIGIAIISLLWGTLQSAGPATSSLFRMPIETAALVFGVIVYFAAISAIFMNFAPIWWAKNKYRILSKKNRKVQYDEFRKEINNYKSLLLNPKKDKNFNNLFLKYQENIILAKNANDNEKIKELKKEFKFEKKEFKNYCKAEIGKIKLELKNFISIMNDEQLHSGLSLINLNKKELIKSISEKNLSEISDIKMKNLETKDNLLNASFEYNNYENRYIEKIKTKKNNKIAAADSIYEGAVGDLLLKYDYINGKNYAIANMEKEIHILKEKIISAKSNSRLQQRIIKSSGKSEQEIKNLLIENDKNTNLKIKKLKAEISKVKSSSKVEINNLKSKHLNAVAENNKNPETLIKLKADHLKAIENANSEFEIDKIAVQQAVAKHLSNFDPKTSNNEIVMVQEIIKIAKQKVKNLQKPTLNSNFSENKNLLQKYYKEIDHIFLEAINNIVEILGENIFTKYDSNKFVNKKVAAYIEILNLQMLWKIDGIISLDINQIKNTSSKTELIKNEFKAEIKNVEVSCKKNTNNEDDFEKEFKINADKLINKLNKKHLMEVQ